MGKGDKMKFIHLSDLHLGKKVNEYSMADDQKYIMQKIIGITREQQPDAVFIAGDVYDKSMPSAEAVSLFDDFLVGLSQVCPHIFVISGNHDSPERIAFGAKLMNNSGIHLSPVYNGEVSPVTLEDSLGKVEIYMLPFIKPANVKRFIQDNDEENDTAAMSYTQAVSFAIKRMNLDPNVRNVLITHQFVTGAVRSESEEITVGGTDNVDAGVFCDFDYVALGHIHAPQSMNGGKIRYCGTPLKYSLSEINHEKSITVVTLGHKNELDICAIPLEPLRDMQHIKGKYSELTARSFYTSPEINTQNYMYITLTDETDVPDAIGKLRVIYPYLMKLDYDNARTRSDSGLLYSDENLGSRDPFELFSEFFKLQNNADMTAEQSVIVNGLIEKIWKGGDTL